MKLSCEITESGPAEITIKLDGTIDEYSQLPFDYDFSNIKKVNVDFKEVSYLNSGGIKTWIHFSEKLAALPDIKIFFHNCNNMVVSQINRTLGFLSPKTDVISVYLPVFCTTCETTFDVHHQVDNGIPTENDVFSKVLNTSCGKHPSCQQHWELDYFNHDFFRFMNSDED